MNKAIVGRLYEQLNTGDLYVVDELISDDFIEHEALPGLWKASAEEGVLKVVRDVSRRISRREVRKRPPGWRRLSRCSCACGTTGTHRAEFMGVPAMGPALLRWAWRYFRIDNNMVVEHGPSTATPANGCSSSTQPELYPEQLPGRAAPSPTCQRTARLRPPATRLVHCGCRLSTTSSMPLTKLETSEARNNATDAMSSRRPISRRQDHGDSNRAFTSTGSTASIIGVATWPGVSTGAGGDLSAGAGPRARSGGELSRG